MILIGPFLYLWYMLTTNMQKGWIIRYICLPVLALFIFLFPPKAFSQSSQFRNFNVRDGLPSSEVYDVIQDSKGFMWFCTDAGVCRFDGYEFKVFNTSNGLPDNTIFEAIEDYKGRIWFRSYNGKLSYYYNDSVFCLPINNILIKQIKGGIITSLAIDTADNVYVGFSTDMKPLKISLRNNFAISQINVPHNTYYIITTPSNGIIKGIYVIGDSITPTYPPRKVAFFNLNFQNKLVHKSQPDYWTQKMFFSKQDKTIQIPGGSLASSLFSEFIVSDSNHSVIFYQKFPEPILNIVPDNKKRIWVVPLKDSPCYYYNGAITKLTALDFLKNKRITSVAVDNKGGLWFTSLSDGVYYLRSLNFKTWTIENGLPDIKVTSINVTPDSLLWITLFQNNKIVLLHNDSISYRTVSDAGDISINSILFYTDKSIWVASSKGVFIFDKAHPVNPQPFLQSIGGMELAQNKDGTVWCSLPHSCRLLYKESSKISIKKNVQFNSKILKILSDGQNGIWIGAANGLYHYTGDSLFYAGNSNPALKNAITDIFFTNDSAMWMATHDTGVIIKNRNRLYYITTANGLINNSCRCICCDYRGNMWVGTRKGLSHIFIKKDYTGGIHIESIKNIYGPNLAEINSVACIGDIVYVATNTCLTAFDMTKTEPDTIAPPVYFTGLKINGEKITISDKKLYLKYNENYIAINYAGLSYTDEGNIKYRYKLLGIDTGWIYTMNTSIQYPSLTDGDYKFVVSARNGDGVWNMQPATFSFSISPPWWKTWWAKITFSVLAIGLIYWRIKAIQLAERKKNEITRQLTLAELQKIKAQFDPHFLFNNLNTLSSLITVAPDNAQEFVDELSQFYHYTISHNKEEFISLSEEIEQAKRYYTLLLIRFGDHLTVEFNNIKPDTEYFILTNSLQILLENVVKHNNILSDTPLAVKIGLTSKPSLLVVNKRYPKKNVQSTGQGLSGINERYKLLTGKEIAISYTTDYFSVELPLLIPKEYENINH